MKLKRCLSILFIVIICLCGCSDRKDISSAASVNRDFSSEQSIEYKSEITDFKAPEYNGKPFAEVNNNKPFFNSDELKAEGNEYYSPLDNLNRCGMAFACISKEIMPTDERGGIGMIKPAGWHTVKYDCVDGKYLYNRCHLIGYQLSGENANERNLITGTRYLNTQGMLPFENKVAEYINETDGMVFYRVTPIYTGNNLLCNGVLMEAESVGNRDICFNVFVFNIQPGIEIDYANGESRELEADAGVQAAEVSSAADYIINKSSKKFHLPDCYSVSQMKAENKVFYSGNRQDLLDDGYAPCKNCNP